jgi:hypothetical protein
MLWLAGVCYLERMWHRAMAAGMIRTLVLSFGLTSLSSNAAEAATNPPIMLVTNVVAQRVVHDVIQTLLQVKAATNLSAFVNGSTLPTQTASPGSFQADKAGSNTNWAAVVEQAEGPGVVLITNTFAGFVPGSLAGAIWAGFHTNGRSTKIWEFWQLPPGWPNVPPVLRWNTNNLMWGRRGMTAISQVCEGEGAFGQGSLTLLTRRHAYLRGHSMGASGLHPEKVGVRVWYCTQDNQVIERKVKLLLVRAREPGSPGDYSIVLFDADLPATIEPMRVADLTKVSLKYLYDDLSHKPVFMTLQGGYVSAGVPGWTVPFAGGDSGAPIMLPLPGELVFFEGLSTSPPSATMQADMDMLSRKAGLDPRRYQMQWVNLDGYPELRSR